MANYLMPAGRLLPPIPQPKVKSEIMTVDPMYKLRIYNKSRTIAFEGYTPQNFSLSLTSAWASPFSDMSLLDKAADATGSKTLGAISKGVKMGGGSSILKVTSAQYWTGPSYLVLDLPILLDAYTDTKKEVVQPLVQLLSLCAPSTGPGGILVPPGPTVSTNVINEVSSSFGGENQPIDDNEAFFVDIGKFLKMSPAVVTSVTSNFDNVWEDESGNPISIDFVLSISSYFAVTREDLAKWIQAS